MTNEKERSEDTDPIEDIGGEDLETSGFGMEDVSTEVWPDAIIGSQVESPDGAVARSPQDPDM